MKRNFHLTKILISGMLLRASLNFCQGTHYSREREREEEGGLGKTEGEINVLKLQGENLMIE